MFVFSLMPKLYRLVQDSGNLFLSRNAQEPYGCKGVLTWENAPAQHAMGVNCLLSIRNSSSAPE